MRNLISSLQNHNRQLKAELHRYKRKFKESQAEVNKLKSSLDDVNNDNPDAKPVRVYKRCIQQKPSWRLCLKLGAGSS